MFLQFTCYSLLKQIRPLIYPFLRIQAVMHADSVLENICAIGLIDGDALRAHLQRHGFDDARRAELQMLGAERAEISGALALAGDFHSDFNLGWIVKPPGEWIIEGCKPFTLCMDPG